VHEHVSERRRRRAFPSNRPHARCSRALPHGSGYAERMIGYLGAGYLVAVIESLCIGRLQEHLGPESGRAPHHAGHFRILPPSHRAGIEIAVPHALAHRVEIDPARFIARERQCATGVEQRVEAHFKLRR
jgi:hypothetical protein